MKPKLTKFLAVSRHPGRICMVLVLLIALLGCGGNDLVSGSSGKASEGMNISVSFAKQLAARQAELDAYFQQAPDVPAPVDAGGGYTHEQHKRNGIIIHDAGKLHEFTGEERFADYAKTLLLRYAEIYPDLGPHPRKKEQTPGRLFWQSLNESVWLVYAAQGYGAIANHLTEAERETITTRLLLPMTDFLSLGQPETFDKIHNHGTWAVAAVGITGNVLGDDKLLNRSLHGLKNDGSSGFMRQLDLLFSPDGYYSEGPYYQRYAMMPFVLLARSIETHQPEMKIFEYRDQILLKAINSIIDLSYADLFFPINDAIKDKGLNTPELRYGVAIAYALTGDNRLLSIAQRQGSYALSADGMLVAQALDQGKAEPWQFKSRLHTDGPNSERGGLAVLRNVNDGEHQAVVLKAVSQGMGHGHFDRLNWLFYDNDNEIVTDYGAARFLNVPQKYGGHYLPENKTWAKQTIAHNTLVVDGRSHFDADLNLGDQRNSRIVHYDDSGVVQIAAAEMLGAYEDVSFSRTLALVNQGDGLPALVIDRLIASGDKPHQYDHPLHFSGQFITSSPHIAFADKAWRPFGKRNGYQHLWKIGELDESLEGPFSMTWLKGYRFYTYHTVAGNQNDIFMVQSGANDPKRNLRGEQALLLRVNKARQHTFIAALEPHGTYNTADEFTLNSSPSIEKLERFSNNESDLIRISFKDGAVWHLGLARSTDTWDMSHAVEADGQQFEWKGYHALFM